MFRKIAVMCCLICGALLSQQCLAQQGDGPDAFFRPVKSNDLIVYLPPRVDKNKLFESGTGDSFFSFDTSGCPDAIYIGSVEDEADVTGSVDIDVNIDGDIYISCGF